MGSRLVLGGDEIHYAESLHRFLHGRFLDGVSEYWSFLYPLFAVPLGALLRDAESGLRLLSVLSGAALVVPTALTAQRLWGRRAALYAGILVALHPMLIFYSTAAMTESLYALLLMFAVFLLVSFIQSGSWRSLVALSIMLGIAYQTRQEAQFIVLLAGIVILIGRGGAGLRAAPAVRLRRVTVLIGVFLVAVLPYLIVLHQKTGRWTTGSKAAVNLSSPKVWAGGMERERYVYRLNAAGTERVIDEAGRDSSLAILWKQRRALAARYFPTMSRGFHLVPMLLASPLLLLIIPLGLVGRNWKRELMGGEAVLLAVGALPFFLYALFGIELRYLVPFLPVYLMWGALGCEVFCEWLGRNISPRPIIRTAALFLILASLIPYSLQKYRATMSSGTVMYRLIGEWIHDEFPGDTRVLAHSGCPVSYYAGNPEATFIPWTDAAGLLRYARHHAFDILVLDETYFIERRPGLLDELESNPPAGLKHVRTFTGSDGVEIRVFRVIAAGRQESST
jgi:hypothetical protein